MVVDFLPVLKHREEVKSTRDAERHPYFYSTFLAKDSPASKRSVGGG